MHSCAGIGLGTESAEQLANKVQKNRKATTRWLRTKVLIIDEGSRTFFCLTRKLPLTVPSTVSMVDGDLFDKLARIGSIIRKRPEPFGAIQVHTATSNHLRSGLIVLPMPGSRHRRFLPAAPGEQG